MKGRAFLIDDFRCPRCGKLLDASSHMDAEDAAPDAGDFSVCIGCASVLVFNDRFTVRKPTDAELAIALADKDVCRARQMIERMMGIKCD